MPEPKDIRRLLRRRPYIGIATRGGTIPTDPGLVAAPGYSLTSDNITHASTRLNRSHLGNLTVVIATARGRAYRRGRGHRVNREISFLPKSRFLVLSRELGRDAGWLVGLLDCGSPLDTRLGGEIEPTADAISAAHDAVRDFAARPSPADRVFEAERYLDPLRPFGPEDELHTTRDDRIPFDFERDREQLAIMRAVNWAQCRIDGRIQPEDLRATAYRAGHLVQHNDLADPYAPYLVLRGAVTRWRRFEEQIDVAYQRLADRTAPRRR